MRVYTRVYSPNESAMKIVRINEYSLTYAISSKWRFKFLNKMIGNYNDY